MVSLQLKNHDQEDKDSQIKISAAQQKRDIEQIKEQEFRVQKCTL